MKVILAIDPISKKLTGIGRYTYELAQNLSKIEGISKLRFFNLGSWVNDPGMLITNNQYNLNIYVKKWFENNKLVPSIYSKITPVYFYSKLYSYHDYLYHSPNFLLPPFPGHSIATFHDLSIYKFPEYHPSSRVRLMENELPKSIKRASQIITVSESIRQEVIYYLGVNAQKVSAIYNGVSPEYFPRTDDSLTKILRHYNLQPRGYFLSVATLEPRKNIDSLITAYDGLNTTIKKYFPLIICGSYGWKSNSTFQRIKDLENKGNIKYFGYVDEEYLPYLYAGAKCFVFIPFYEGFGLPVLEAMASGTPVIASRISSLAEITQNTAYLVNPYDISEIREAMEYMANDSEIFSDNVVRANLIATSLTWNNTAKKTFKLYQDIVSNNQ